MTFDGFDPVAVAMLGRLPGMDADEYGAHKATVSTGLTEPGAGLIAAVADRLDADLTVVPRSSVSPLHRDLRFAPTGSARYKGDDTKRSPTFWIRVDANRAGWCVDRIAVLLSVHRWLVANLT